MPQSEVIGGWTLVKHWSCDRQTMDKHLTWPKWTPCMSWGMDNMSYCLHHILPPQLLLHIMTHTLSSYIWVLTQCSHHKNTWSAWCDPLTLDAAFSLHDQSFLIYTFYFHFHTFIPTSVQRRYGTTFISLAVVAYVPTSVQRRYFDPVSLDHLSVGCPTRHPSTSFANRMSINPLRATG